MGQPLSEYLKSTKVGFFFCIIIRYNQATVLYKENLLERREGIAIAVRQGKYKGCKAVNITDFSQHYERYMSREVSKAQLAKELNISRPTLDKLIKQHKRGWPPRTD